MLIAVYHNSSSINLYISDAEGLSYSLSLDNVMGPDDESSWVGATTPQLEVHVVRVRYMLVNPLILSKKSGGKYKYRCLPTSVVISEYIQVLDINSVYYIPISWSIISMQ